MIATDERVYVGSCPTCGATHSFWVANFLDPDSMRRALREVKSWQRHGAALRVVSVAEARTIKLQRCHCPSRRV